MKRKAECLRKEGYTSDYEDIKPPKKRVRMFSPEQLARKTANLSIEQKEYKDSAEPMDIDIEPGTHKPHGKP